MNSYKEELYKFSYPLHKSDLDVKTEKDFIKINPRDQADIERT
jgi:hypothetical protein